MNRWFEKSYRRNLVDMHIEDWNPEFLSEFDPDVYAGLLKTANVKSVMIYMNSHVGCCYWPTKSGYVHRQMRNGDKMGRLIDLCHEQGMDVILYMSLLANNRAYETHPEWRTAGPDGSSTRSRGGRFGGCCGNSPGYRQFVDEQVKEICARYEAEGIFFDMATSGGLCYCKSCRERYKRETGKEIPTVIDWNNPDWVEYQQVRKRFVTDFALYAYNTVKKYKPEWTVEHNSSPFRLIDWRMGCSIDTVRANDFVGGDIYGEPIEQSLTCKFFDSITPNKPFEYMTSRCGPHLVDHTTTKPRELLELNAFYSLAHNGAFMFIDAIDPKGTLNPAVYELMGDIFRKMEYYEPYTGGEMCADVGIYLSMESDFREDDTDLSKISAFYSPGLKPHLDGLHGVTRVLKEKNVPFGVVTNNAIKSIKQYQVIVLPDINIMGEDEKKALCEYVQNGGSLYISGSRLPDLVQSLIGAGLKGKTRENVTYVEPAKAGETLFEGVNLGSPLMVDDYQTLIESEGLAPEEILATITLPYTDPKETAFASIHSNPPGKATDDPAIICKRYGKGRVVWTSSALETNGSEPHKELFFRLIKMLAQRPFAFESTAPKPVEIITYYQKDNRRYIVNVVNAQEQIPPISADDIKIRLNTKGIQPAYIKDVSTGNNLDFHIDGLFAEFSVPRLEIYEMIEVKLKEAAK